jgi:hypothetical protein
MPSVPGVVLLSWTIALFFDTIPREFPGWTSALASQGIETVSDLVQLEISELHQVLALAGITALLGQTNAIRAHIRAHCQEMGLRAIMWNWPGSAGIGDRPEARNESRPSPSPSEYGSQPPRRDNQSSTKPLFDRDRDSSIKTPLVPRFLLEYAKRLGSSRLQDIDINFICYCISLYQGLHMSLQPTSYEYRGLARALGRVFSRQTGEQNIDWKKKLKSFNRNWRQGQYKSEHPFPDCRQWDEFLLGERIFLFRS